MLDRYHPPTNLPENSNILVRIRLSILKCNLSALLKKKEKGKIIIAKFPTPVARVYTRVH